MSILEIRKYGDAVLAKPGKPVANIDDKLLRLIDDMFETMYAEPGVGLAAPQVGVGLQLCVVDLNWQGKKEPMVLINPKIEFLSPKSIAAEEGCLSFPKIFFNVSRPDFIRLSAINEKGFPVTIEGDGLLARCLQHELDHLNGRLIIDHLSFWKRWKVEQDIKRRKKEGDW
jgi:peptide deformylase